MGTGDGGLNKRVGAGNGGLNRGRVQRWLEGDGGLNKRVGAGDGGGRAVAAARR